MSDNSINISGLDFKKLPDDWKIEIDSSKISYQTGKALEKIDGIDISDGIIDKNEAELIIMAINTDENADEIDMDEINKFCSDNKITNKAGEVKTDAIEGLVTTIVTNSREVLEAKQDKQSDNVDKDNGQTTEETGKPAVANETEQKSGQEETAGLKISIQVWGSAPVDGNKYANDCLDHIMRNNYPDLKPYSQEWFDKELEIMNANPEIYGTVDNNGNVTGARKSVGGTGRHNAVLYDSDELTLPATNNAAPTAETEPLSTTPAETDKKTEPDNSVNNSNETDNANGNKETGNAENQTPVSKPENTEDTGTPKEETDDNGYLTKTFSDENGNVTKKELYDNNGNQLWESTLSAGENNTIVETRNWTQSGEVQKITYDENGKEVSMTTTYADSSTATVNYSHDENGTKSAEVIFNNENGEQTATGNWQYNEDGTITETKNYTNNTNIKETNTYDQYQNILNKTVTKTAGENNAKTTTTVTEYENRKPSSTTEYAGEEAKEENKILTTNYEYTETGYTSNTTYANPQGDNDPASHSIVYDNDGKTIGADTVFKNGTTSHTDYIHNEDGSHTETIAFTYPEGVTPEANNYKTLQTIYNSAGNKTSETYTLVGNETTGEISGTNTFEDGRETRTQIEANTGKSTVKIIEGDATTIDVLQNDTETITASNGDVKTSEKIIKYEPGTENIISTTETEFQADGTTLKTVKITDAQGVNITGHYDENGTLISTEGEGDKTLLPNHESLKETSGIGEALKLTQLSAAEQNELDTNGSITKGEYTIQKMDDGSLRTSKIIKIEENGIIKDAQMIIKEEWPNGEIKLYENNNGERRIAQHLDENGNISTYSYSDDYRAFIYDKKTYSFTNSDTIQTRQTVETKDPDGNIVSSIEYVYDDQGNQTEIARNVYKNGQLTNRIDTAKINTYAETLKTGYPGGTTAYEAMIAMLDDTDISCSDLAEILNKLKSEDKTSNFMDYLPKNDKQEQAFFDKLATVIERSTSDEVGNFLKSWQEHNDGKSLMNSIQDRQSWGTETKTLKNIAKTLNDKVQNLGIDYSSDSILAMAQRNNIMQNTNNLFKVFDLKDKGAIDDKTALSLLLYICNGDIQALIDKIRDKDILGYTYTDKRQEQYVKFIEDLIISATTT